MTSLEAYIQLKEIVNKSNVNDNIELDVPRAVILLNNAQIKFLKKTIENKNNENIRRVQHLLVSQNIKNPSKDKEVYTFKLPDNYFEFSNISPKAKKGGCVDRLLAWEIKAENVHELINDSNNEPSFYWRETFYNIRDNKVALYYKDFEILEVDILYYRLPRKIDVSGYITINNDNSVDSHPEWDDYSIQKILEIAAKDFNINTDNLQRFQVDQARIQIK